MKTQRVLRTLAVGLAILAVLFLVAMYSPAEASPPADPPDPQEEKADIRGAANPSQCQVGMVRLSRDILAYPTKDLAGFSTLWLDTNTYVTVEECSNTTARIRVYGMMMSYWLRPGDIAGGWHDQAVFDWSGKAFGGVRTGTKVDRFQWQPSPTFSPSQVGPGLPPPSGGGGVWHMVIVSVTGWARPSDLGFGEPIPPTCPPCPSPPTCPPCPGPGPVQKTLAQECNLRKWPWQPGHPAPPIIGVLPVGSTVDVLFDQILGTTSCGPDQCTNRWTYVRARNWTTPTVGFLHGSCLRR